MSEPEGEADRWFRFAEEDLRGAIVCLNDTTVPPRHACYFAQQAAEKALKACLIECDFEYPRSHDLDYLRNLLPPEWRIHETHPVLRALTEWNAEARYPGDWPDAVDQDAYSAIAIARAVLDVLRGDMSRHRQPDEHR
jgi:HEPN domain-containing protein